MNSAMNESAMRTDRGGDDKGKAFFNRLSQDHLDVFIREHSSRTSQGRADMDECALVTVKLKHPTNRQERWFL